MSIEKIFNNPEMKKAIKSLEREVNEGLSAVRNIYTRFGIDGIDEVTKKVVSSYKEEREAIVKKFTDMTADITYVPATRARRKKAEDTAATVASNKDAEAEDAKEKPANQNPVKGKGGNTSKKEAAAME